MNFIEEVRKGCGTISSVERGSETSETEKVEKKKTPVSVLSVEQANTEL